MTETPSRECNGQQLQQPKERMKMEHDTTHDPCFVGGHFTLLPFVHWDRGHGRQGLGRTGPSLARKLFVGDFGSVSGVMGNHDLDKNHEEM
jgi:hypothetical protein